jgi:hypothetical protein
VSIAVKMAKLAYIGGYGRSGSSLLEYLMTASPQVVGCGEVTNCLRKRRKSCTCRQAAEHCSVWSLFFASEQARDWTHVDLTLALLNHVSSSYELMVDSSKTAWWSIAVPFKLRQRLGKNFELIHLVRDPRAVCWSSIQSKQKHAMRSNHVLGCIWSTLGWWTANLSCECFGWLHPDQYVRVRYEDLARSPAEVLEKLFAKLLPGVAWDPEKIGSIDNRHQLHGNRMRKRPLSVQMVQEDVRWRKEMPFGYHRLVASLSWTLLGRYGYS